MCLTPPETSDEDAIAAFENRHHCQPAEKPWRCAQFVHVGPTPKLAYSDPAWLETFTATSPHGGRRLA